MDLNPKEAASEAAGHLVAYEPDVADAVAGGLQDIWVRSAPAEPGMDYGDGKLMVHEENIVITDSGAQLLTRRAAPQLPVID